LNKHAVVVGGGFVGLQEAVLFAKRGFNVTIIDHSDKVVNAINKAKEDLEYLHIKEKYVVENWSSVKDRISVSKKYTSAKEANVIVLAVNTPVKVFGEDLIEGLTHDYNLSYFLDFSPLENAVRNLSKVVNNGTYVNSLVTIYPGGTNSYIINPLEEAGFKLGRDIYITHTPERVDPGNNKYTLDKIPRNLGYRDSASLKIAFKIYRDILNVNLYPKELSYVELSKLHENAFRLLNIAFVQESLAKYGAGIIDVIELAGTKPFGFLKMYPSPYAGGSCLVKDSIMYYISTKNSLIKEALIINERMPKVYAQVIYKKIKERGYKKILFYGLGFKPGSSYYVSRFLNPVERMVMELRKLDHALELKRFDPKIPEYSDFKSKEEALRWSDTVIYWNYKDILSL